MFTVNADDFGIHETSTFAILECFKRGWLDTTTAMMNMPECGEAIELASENKLQGKIGIHLNLTWGTPLTDDIKRDPLFCDKDGEFTGRFHRRLVNRFWIPSASRYAVAKELRAQLDAFVKSEFSWRHIDSHHHVHMDLSILPIVIALAKEYGMETVRIGRNIGKNRSIFNDLYKQVANAKLRKAGLAFTDYFGSPFDAIENDMSGFGDCQVELMVHPIYRLGEERSMKGTLRDFVRPIEDVENVLSAMRGPQI